jgi:hypothetical protein
MNKLVIGKVPRKWKFYKGFEPTEEQKKAVEWANEDPLHRTPDEYLKGKR